MSGISITASTDGLSRLKSAAQHLSIFGLRKMLKGIGGLIEAQVRERISDTHIGPDGKKWEPLTKAYEGWKSARSSGGLLVLHGHLRDSIQWYLNGDELIVGSNMEYAPTHQLGFADGGIPARSYLGLSEDNKDEIEDTVIDYLDNIIKRGR